MADIIKKVSIVVEGAEALQGLKEGAVEAKEALNDLSGASDALGGATSGAASGLKGTSDGLKDASKELKDSKKSTKEAASGFSELEKYVSGFEKRVGFAAKALSGFGLLAIPGALKGIYDLVMGWYSMTEAGKASEAQAQAQKAAIDDVASSLRDISDLTRIATADIVDHLLATEAMNMAQSAVKKSIEERMELEKEREALVAESIKAEKAAADALRLHPSLYSELRDSAEEAEKAVDEINDRIAENDLRLQSNVEAHRDAQAALAETRKQVAALGEPLEILGDAFDRLSKVTGDAQKKAVAEAQRRQAEAARLASARLATSRALTDQEIALISDLSDREEAAFEERARRQIQDLEAKIRTGEATQADKERALASLEVARAEGEKARGLREVNEYLKQQKEADEALREIEQQWINETATALALEERWIKTQEDSVDSTLNLLKAKQDLEVQQARLGGSSDAYIAKLQEVQAAELAAATATKASASAYAASSAAAVGAAASLAESLGASAKVVAGIRVAQEIAEAASSGAAAATAFASGNIPGGIAHTAAAVEHVAAAVKWGSDALGGGGGGKAGGAGGAAKAPTPTPSAQSQASAQDRVRAMATPAGGDTFNFPNAQPLATKTELQDALVRGINEAKNRRSAPKIDSSRTRRQR